ncbi:MAG: hypothetical protein C0484_22055 [Rhodospirillum sp.]|nr:hypothetical protein [Rhodospirillum sp.]
MTRARPDHRRKVTVPALLATASLIALLAGMPEAAAEDCSVQAPPPANLATPSMVYETLSARTNAQLLAMAFMRKPVEQACAWIYEVRLMTASGSVVELDFNADGLGLVGARGPQDDRDAADLVRTLGGDAAVLTVGTKEETRGKGSNTATGSGKGSGQGSGSDDGGDGGDDGGEGGEGGNSGSGSSGSGEGGDGSGEGGNSGSGGGGNSGSGGGGEGGGGEGGGSEGGEGGD